MGAAVLIPARYASTRLPGKPLADLGGLPMIERVRRAALTARGVDRVAVVTDDLRIAGVIREHGGIAYLTGEHPSGTDRVAEVASTLGYAHIVNVQGDMPMVRGEHVEAVLALLRRGAPIATLATPWPAGRPLGDPHGVKVWLEGDRARDFSRAPFAPPVVPHLHLGIYGFQREILMELRELSVHDDERSQGLEQLRWLRAGYAIGAAVVSDAGVSVDTPEQLAALQAEFQ